MVPLNQRPSQCSQSADGSADGKEGEGEEGEEACGAGDLFPVPRLTSEDTVFLLLHGNAKVTCAHFL